MFLHRHNCISLKWRFLPLAEILFHYAMRLHLPSGILDLGKFVQDVRLRWQNDRKGLENENVCKGKLKRKCSETLLEFKHVTMCLI